MTIAVDLGRKATKQTKTLLQLVEYIANTQFLQLARVSFSHFADIICALFSKTKAGQIVIYTCQEMMDCTYSQTDEIKSQHFFFIYFFL